MIWRFALATSLLVPAMLLANPVTAPGPLAYTQLPDPGQEAEAKALMQTLRCVVCQGQSIADSDADLAGDMRAIVRQQIAAGASPDAVRAWMIGRYGRWVSYKPTVDPVTWPLWGAPVIMLIVGGFLAGQAFQRRRRR